MEMKLENEISTSMNITRRRSFSAQDKSLSPTELKEKFPLYRTISIRDYRSISEGNNEFKFSLEYISLK